MKNTTKRNPLDSQDNSPNKNTNNTKNNTNNKDLRYCFVIPVYRHGSTLMKVVDSIQKYFLPIIIVDDGNDATNKKYIKEVIDKYHYDENTFNKINISNDANDKSQQNKPGKIIQQTKTNQLNTQNNKSYKKYAPCILVELPKNYGKGVAMKAGIIRAHDMGFTHIFQLDSDGQHDLKRVAAFLKESYDNPAAVICGYGAYDKTAPRHRVNGRKVANAWVHIVTLSSKIKDSMIGFRIYPTEPSYIIETHSKIDARMGFDIDLLVHLAWLGVPIINKQVKISYPLDGISNFRNFRDNVRISVVYTKLCVTMIIKWPIFVARKLKRKIACNKGYSTNVPACYARLKDLRLQTTIAS